MAEIHQSRGAGSPGQSAALTTLRERMGLVAAEGPGLVVTLDDSTDEESPSGNLNDLVIHSQDVQAVANGLWAAGAEALAVNGQRVVPTSAVLCVGNTLLINGTVHSPPFRFTALGANLQGRLHRRPAGEALRRRRRPLQAGLQGREPGPGLRPGLYGHLQGPLRPGRLSTVWPVGLVLVIDNYDSFVYNLVQYLGELGSDPLVYRHDEAALEQLVDLEPAAVLVSPGPGRPEDAGVSNAAIDEFGRRGVPVLGVCLGHQCIGQLYGGQVVRAGEVMHGKTSMISHSGDGLFAGLPNPFEATRYHSLVVDRASVPDCLEITAETEDGIVMGLRHKELPVVGVQFHPESILTEAGHKLLENFLALAPAH